MSQEQLGAVFRSFNSNSDGSLDREEVLVARPPPGPRAHRETAATLCHVATEHGCVCHARADGRFEAGPTTLGCVAHGR